MNLTEKLLALDVAKYKEVEKGEIEIKRLSKLTGEPFIVKIKEVDSKRMTELQGMLFNKSGDYDVTKSRDVNALVCCEGIMEPLLSDTELMNHFGAATPKELAQTLFKGADLGTIADEIAKLSNFIEGESELKNE